MSTYDDEDYEPLDLDDADAEKLDGDVEDIDDADDDTVDDAADDDDEDDEDDDDEDDEDDEDDDDEDDGDDDDEDDLEDATADEIDFVIAAYREDGQPVVTALSKELANDLDGLITQLSRLPGDAGAVGFVSLVEEVFVIVRARGRTVQVLLSDDSAAADFPIARDVADFLGLEVPDEEDDSEPMGDLDLLSDLGVSSFDMTLFCDVEENSSDTQLVALAEQLKLGSRFAAVVRSEMS